VLLNAVRVGGNDLELEAGTPQIEHENVHCKV
jgi:hypothetical protein